ncbi:hypothetical protein LCM20_10135 [Halobacillus litoralis]|uniref:hypothetical protein n=1 Tax=Halobacillus litoralis TaxID=45668 RepID=UPI001CD563BC|nr:hypothetical protein [Halobacillus litoralis]MCA0970949.1 hypothetical protein [Halobacillus litoralis]
MQTDRYKRKEQRMKRVQLSEVITKINKSVDEMDLVTARTYIEENLDELEDQKHLMKGNARELVNFFIEKRNKGEQPLTRQEMSDIYAVNVYAKRFDVRGLKLMAKNKKELFMKQEALNNLSADSKTLLKSMGIIEK